MSPELWEAFILKHLKPVRQAICSKWRLDPFGFTNEAANSAVANCAVTLRALIQASLSGDSPNNLQVPPALQILGCSEEDARKMFEGLSAADLDLVRDNFGWLCDAEQAFLARDPKAWPLLHKLSILTDPESADPTPNHLAEGLADELSDLWTPGCRPVVVDGKLEAVVLRLPYSGYFPHHRTEKTANRFKRSDSELRLRPVFVGLGGMMWGSQEWDEHSHRLGLQTFVLTPQRAQFLSRAIELPKEDRHGLMITGAAGSGKTATLRALAWMLTVGAGGDLLYLPSSTILSPRRSMNCLGQELAKLSLGYSCGEALVSEELHSLFWELGRSATSVRALAKLLHPTKGHFTAKRGEVGTPPRMLIVDETYFLHIELLKKREACHAKHWKVVRRLLSWAEPCNKLLAYGPEAPNLCDFGQMSWESLFNFPPGLDMQSTFMELGFFSHNLAIHLLCGHGLRAPNTSDDSHEELTSFETTPIGADIAFLLPAKYREMLSCDPEAHAMLHKYVKNVAAGQRMLSWLVRDIKDVRLCKEDVLEKLERLVRTERERLSEQLTEHANFRVAKGADPTVYSQLMSADMLMSHSILQRKNPLGMDLAGNTQPVTPTGFKALLQALREAQARLQNLVPPRMAEYAGQELQEADPYFWCDAVHAMNVAMLLKMGLFGGQYDQLSIADGPTPAQMLGNWALTPRRCSGFLQLREEWDSDCRNGKDAKSFAFSDIAALHGLPVDGIHTVQTHGVIPNLDFVVFRRAKQDGRDRLQVCFLVTTTEPLSFRSNLQPLQNLKSEVGEAEAAELLNSGSLMRLIGLIADESWHAQPGHLAQTMALSRGSGDGAELSGSAERKVGSLASSVLWSFGVPVAVPGHIRRSESGQAVLSMRPELVGSDHRLELQEHVRKVLEVEARTSTDSGGSCGEEGEDAATFIDSISQLEDVDLFFVYCTAAEIGDDAGLHDPRLCDIPSFLGVFGNDNMCGLHTVGVPLRPLRRKTPRTVQDQALIAVQALKGGVAL